MAEPLDLSRDLKLPIEVAGQVIAIFGIRNSGKSSTAGVIAEELLDRQQQVVVIDPTDGWWGLRSGYPIFIFGGPHGDIPLAETDGKGIAEFVVIERMPLILSLRHLPKGAQRRFVAEFCEEMYHLKGKHDNRAPMTVIIDEAPLFVPQRVFGDVARVVGAVEDLCARGRNTGFGTVLVTQRPATLNKDVLSQADTIVAHRLISPQDRNALGAWLEENTSAESLKTILASLAGMPTGMAWVWAPGLDIMRQVQIRKRRTFDSSASPKVGEVLRPPKRLQEVNLETLKAKLAANMERAQAEDPRLLRKKIAELTRELSAAREKVARVETVPVEVPVLKEAMVTRLEEGIAKAAELQEHGAKVAGEIIEAAWALRDTLREAAPRVIDFQARPVSSLAGLPPGAVSLARRSDRSSYHRSLARETVHHPPSTGEKLTGPEQRILDAAAWLESIGIRDAEQTAVAFLAGYTAGGGAFNNPRGSLHTKGLIVFDRGRIELTNEGRAMARSPLVPLTAAELHERVLDRLPGPERKILSVLIKAYPNSVSNAALARAAGYEPNGGAYNNPRGRLRTLGLIEYPRPGEVVARPILFLEGDR